MIIERYPAIHQLPAAEKFILVSELWDDLAEQPGEVPAPHGILEELDKRMEHFRQNPDQFATWEPIQQSVLGHQA